MTLDELRELAEAGAPKPGRCTVLHYDEFGNPTSCPDEARRERARSALIRRLGEVAALCDRCVMKPPEGRLL